MFCFFVLKVVVFLEVLESFRSCLSFKKKLCNGFMILWDFSLL